METNRLMELYRLMARLRAFDELCLALKMKDLIYSGYHPYVGQEAVAAGFCPPLRPDDAVLSTHRAHCHAVAKGSPVRVILAEMMGRRPGGSGGLGGGMQILHVENHFYSGSIVGSGIPIAAGVALAMKQQGTDRVCLCLFGDGASNTGSFHEGLNLAAIWRLPVVYVCENNQFAEAMPAREFVAGRIADRARAYGLDPIEVDGNDVEATAAAAETAIAQARAGRGPVLIEAVTYRIRGHYYGDPEQTYRTKEEVEEWRKKCPLKRCRARLESLGAEPADLDRMEADVRAELEADKAWCLEQRFPTLPEATEHVTLPLGR